MIIPGIFTDLKAFSQPHYFWKSSSLMLQLEWIAQSPELPKLSSSKVQLKCHLPDDAFPHPLCQGYQVGVIHRPSLRSVGSDCLSVSLRKECSKRRVVSPRGQRWERGGEPDTFY